VPVEAVRGWRVALATVRVEFEDAYLRHRARR
jgi:hypothetical protein